MEITELYKLFAEHPHISTDSRNIQKNSLFFALKGDIHDANIFAKDALENGAAFAIVDNPELAVSGKYILVDNALETLHQLAHYHRSQFNIPVLAITGSNGKTTTRELISSVLGKKYNCLSTQGNLNNHIGVPLTLLQLTSAHNIAVIEMGANHIGEISNLCHLALPTYGLITNIGRAHLEGFGSFEGVIAAKTELYNYIKEEKGKVFVNICDELLMKHASDISRVTYGLDPSADYGGEIIHQHPFLSLNCSENCTRFEVKTRITGTYNANNIVAAICIGRYFGVAVNEVVNAIATYLPQNNRSQVLDTGNNHLLLDAYNANPSSMALALDNFSTHPVHPKMCILGDMMELGDYTDQEHRQILNLVRKSGFEKVIFIGEYFHRQMITDSAITFFADTGTAKKWLATQKVKGYNILVKGSRKIQLEGLIDVL